MGLKILVLISIDKTNSETNDTVLSFVTGTEKEPKIQIETDTETKTNTKKKKLE